MSTPTPTRVTTGSLPAFPEQGELYRILFQTSFAALALSGAGRFVDVNDAALRLFGYRREDLIGREVVLGVAPEFQAETAATIAANREVTYEIRLVRQDGSQFDAEVQAKTITVGGRQFRLSIVRDITERLQNAESLHASQAKLGLAL